MWRNTEGQIALEKMSWMQECLRAQLLIQDRMQCAAFLLGHLLCWVWLLYAGRAVWVTAGVGGAPDQKGTSSCTQAV